MFVCLFVCFPAAGLTDVEQQSRLNSWVVSVKLGLSWFYSRSMKRSSGPCDFWRFSSVLLKRIWGKDPAAHQGDPRRLPDVRFKEVRKLAHVPTDRLTVCILNNWDAMSGETEGQEVKLFICTNTKRVPVGVLQLCTANFSQRKSLNGLCWASHCAVCGFGRADVNHSGFESMQI